MQIERLASAVKERWLNKRQQYFLQHLTESRRIHKLVGILFVVMALHVISMISLENMSLWRAVWLTLITISTVGYGDFSAQSPYGQAATVAFMILPGIYLYGTIISEWIEYRSFINNLKVKGHWRWFMEGHIVILNTPADNPEQYFIRLVKEFRATEEFKDTPVCILTNSFRDGLPEALRSLNVTHTTGRADDENHLESVSVCDAELVIVLAKDFSDSYSDGRTFDVLSRLSSMGCDAHVLAECVDDDNRDRLITAGAVTVVRPMRSYPSVVVRAVQAEGYAQLMENMFNHSGDNITRVDIRFKDVQWGALVVAFTMSGCGTLMAYVNDHGRLISNPGGEEVVSGKGLLVFAKEHVSINDFVVASLVDKSKEPLASVLGGVGL